jgi:hypothetical protein
MTIKTMTENEILHELMNPIIYMKLYRFSVSRSQFELYNKFVKDGSYLSLSYDLVEDCYILNKCFSLNVYDIEINV